MKSLWFSLLLGAVQALIPLTIKGNRFIHPALSATQEGVEFSVVGVDYQPGGSSAYDASGSSDVLSDGEVCLRDAFVLQQLGVNIIRVYTINPWINHDECMSIFNAAGIYLLIDVNSPSLSLDRYNPASTYSENYLNQVFGVIDAFKGYPNLLGFFSGNEVVNDDKSASVVPQYIRAVQRDMKEYMSKHSDRQVPVGYSAADVDSLRQAMWLYLECGNDTSVASYFAINSYSWCSGINDWQTSGYGTLETEFANSSIPVFFSEYGCNTKSPRTFTEVYQGIYAELENTFSGGLVYEYSQETSNYGLVNINDNGSVSILQDYVNLQQAYQKITLPTTGELQINSINAPSCQDVIPQIQSLDSNFQTNFTLPACPAQSMLDNGGGNNNIGKIISLTTLASNYSIYDVNGNQISNITISVNPTNLINSQSGTATGTPSATAAAASASSTQSKSKGAATTIEAGGILAGLFVLISMLI